MNALKTAGVACCLAVFVLGCGRDRQGAEKTVTVTNVIEIVRETVVTNAVTVTNVVAVSAVRPRALSARKTAPYLVVSKALRGAQLRKLLVNAGARVLECDPGAVALVEAPDKVIDPLRAGEVVAVFPLRAEDKVAADVGECVRIVPLSAIDVMPLAEAVRGLGGDVVQTVSSGNPLIRARLSYAALRRLAERGDVRKIERDKK